jgi:tetratricopeptide (TPR) repeat protein
MKNCTILFFLILFSLTVFAQKPKPIKKAFNTNSAKSIGGEKEEFEKARAQTNATDRIKALKKFVANFPNSAEKIHALELMVVARAQAADEKLRAGDAAVGTELFKLAVKEAPTPLSDKLFADIILQIPNNLFFRGQRDAAVEIARMIEGKIGENAKQLLGLATFYLGGEDAAEAQKLADRAIAIEPNLPAAYQTLGLANRLNFNLDEAANAYAKALELDANSIVSRRSLAEMKRATGKSDEAIALYREILAKDAADVAAQNGLILSLFDANKKSEAEAELQKSLEQNPKNLSLLVGAAYSYAARGNGARAVEFAEKAIAVEPRYIWSYLALARGHLLQNRYFEAERALMTARNYGNFPTLDYELASVRLAGGFYREAAQELAKNFAVKDDAITTKLGGRVEKQAQNFTDLLALERRASLFEPLAADSSENAEKLKYLLSFYKKTEAPETAGDDEISDAADKFIGGTDKMKLHRQLFAAERLLEKKKSLPKVIELMRAAIGGVDAALDVPNPSSAVLAEQLYDARSLAIAKNQLVVIPAVPRQTLSNILRGRIEEITGWALFQENKPSEAAIRLKRAVSVLPEKSAWWRSSMWRLGAALQADDKQPEALDAYIKSYSNDNAPSAAKRIIIESLYQKINGSLDGLDAKIGAKPASDVAIFAEQKVKTQAKSQTTEIQTPIATVEPSPKTENAPQTLVTEIKPMPEMSLETKTETKQTDKTETNKNSAVENAEKTQKPLFEPIIITVPKTDVSTNPKTDNQTDKERKCQIIVGQENILLSSDGGNLSVSVGFEGDLGDANEIKTTSNSPEDVEVVLEPETEAPSNRVLFIVKSISAKTGTFTVKFNAPCGGEKEIKVKVR